MSPIRLEIEHMNGVTERFVKYRILVVVVVGGAALAALDPLCNPREKIYWIRKH